MRHHLKNLLPFVIISSIYLFVTFVLALQYSNSLEHLCLFKNTTGMPCPGCGLTRSYLALLKGDIVDAFNYHPLFFTIPFILLIIAFLNVGFKPSYKKLLDRCLYGMLFLIMITYVWRMILHFPHHPPMNFNPEALIPKIINFIKFR